MELMYLGLVKHLSVSLFWIPICYGQINADSKAPSTVLFGESFFFYEHRQYPRDCEEVHLQCSATNSSDVYLIKPDGYPNAFQVFCDFNIDGGVWTVVQRRTEGSIDFFRTWGDYKEGFGFLWNEFWVGFEKLSFMTNQKNYKVRIDMEDTTGLSFYVEYDMFRISDEKGDFRITRLGEYTGTAVRSVGVACPAFMEFGNCTCQKTCQDPDGIGCQTTCDEGESRICEDGFLKKGEMCVRADDCGCFVEGEGFILNGHTHVNIDCTSRCQCQSNVLTCDDNYGCSSEATCEERDGVRQCYCNNGYTGDGQVCEVVLTPEDCADIYNGGVTDSGIYTIKPTNWPGSSFQVYCNMSEREGWTVFQRRIDGSQDFNVGWDMYKEGFGSSNHEVWLGNEKLYYMTTSKNYQLRIDLVDRNNSQFLARYDLFRISNENNDYTLAELGSFSGNTGYDAMSWHRNEPFSTYDRDNDGWNAYNCAQRHHGGWWFGRGYTHTTSNCETEEYYCDYWPFGGDSCGYCSHSHLNGDYTSVTRGTNIHWSSLSGYDCNIVYTEMKIRPI